MADPVVDARALEAHPLALAEEARPSSVTVRDLARSFLVRSHEEYERAGGVLRTVKGEWKRLDDLRKAWTGPLYNVQRSINGAFAGPLGALAEAEQALKTSMAAFDAAQEEARRAAVTETPGASPVPFMPEAEGVSVRVRRAFRIVDPDAVPRQFCSPDENLIKAHLAAGGVEAIKGVEFFDERIVSARAVTRG